MKTIIFTFSILTLLSCGNDNDNDNEQDKSIITENAAIYFYLDAGFGGSDCDYVIETHGGKTYKPKSYSNLSEFGISNGRGSKTEIEISYRLTEESVDRCFHKEGFLTTPTVIVETISIKRRGATLPSRN